LLEKARQKLISWNIGVVIALLASVVLALYFSISNSIQKEVDTELKQSAATIVQTTRFVPAANRQNSPPTPAKGPAVTPGKQDESEEGASSKGLSDGEKLETSEDTRITISNVFYFILDTRGKVLANPRQISSRELPALNSLNRVVKGESFFQDLKIEKGISVRLYSVPLRGENGQVAGVLQVGEDMTIHQEQLANVLLISALIGVIGTGLALVAAFFLTNQALVPVRLSMQRQRDFVADASHELRTPLTLIQANTEVILRNKNKTIGEKAELLEDIHQETQYLTRLLADLLTLARADSNTLDYKLEPVDLRRLAGDTARQIKPLVEAKGLKLKVILPENNREIWLLADPLRLKQLLVILLDNAIKYTNTGQVQLTISQGSEQAVVITVQDTGIGIAQDKLKVIFDRFYRVDKARSRSGGESGFGLGLAIARWIIDVHKGNVQVKSQPGQGSTFTVTLPTNLPPEFNRP
jgi:signal transduction histidine kinase